MTHIPHLPPLSAAGSYRPVRGWESLRLLAHNRYQLLGAVIVAVLLPGLANGGLDLDWRRSASAENTALATLACVFLGAFIRRQLSAFPGAERFGYVFLAFAAAYGATVLAFFMLRLDYARAHLVLSFLAALSWFLFVSAVEARACRPRFLVIPRGDATSLIENSLADWHVALDPENVPSEVWGVVADLYADHDEAWQAFLARCALQGLPVYHSRQLKESLTGRVTIRHLSENNLGSVLPPSVYMTFKRMADLVAVLLAAPAAGALALAAAVMIKLEDGGPVLFRQERRGFRGATFTMLKFRTMRVEGFAGAKAFTDEDDPRVTRVGRLLRRYRIDELPQLVNIVRGEMSWIGPRPEALSLSEWYEASIPHYVYRHMVLPGITGWAQINQGNVAEVAAAQEKLEYDFYYIRNLSVWLELLIAVRTVRTVLTGFGAR